MKKTANVKQAKRTMTSKNKCHLKKKTTSEIIFLITTYIFPSEHANYRLVMQNCT